MSESMIAGYLSGSFHMISFLPSEAFFKLTVPSSCLTGALIRGSEHIMFMSNFEVRPILSGFSGSTWSKVEPILSKAGSKMDNSFGVHWKSQNIELLAMNIRSTWPYCMRQSPFARSGRPLKTSRSLTNISDELSRISWMASIRSCRILRNSAPQVLKWHRKTYCLSINGWPIQFRRSLAPNFVFVRSRTHISDPRVPLSVSFRYTSKLVSVFAAKSMWAFEENFVKNFVSKNASAIPKAERYLMAWARAMTTLFGKSAMAARSFPEIGV